MAPLTLNKEAYMKIALLALACSFALAGATFAQTTANAAPTLGTSGTRAPAARAEPSAAAASTDYRLAPGDKLRIDVYKDDKLSQSLQIRPDGKITMPLIGDLPAAGHTPIELRDSINSALTEYIANAVVTVIVVETTPQLIYVTGEVNRPGAVPLVSGRMSVVQAIAMAGGFTDFAKRKDVLIMRKTAKGMETLHFNYKETLDSGNPREPPTVMPGDTIVVK
jgi:polysaccharide export outer membrane protein